MEIEKRLMEIEGIEKRLMEIERNDFTATSNRINAIEKTPSFLFRQDK